MMQLYYSQICVHLTPYNIVWTSLVLALFYFSKRSKTGLKNLKVSLPQEAHMLLGHARFLENNFMAACGRLCAAAADAYGLSSFFVFKQLVVSGKVY